MNHMWGFLILALKLLKSGKILLAALTLGAYSYVFTWQFALAIMWAIGVHEMGHVWAMRRTGMKTPGFYFIPFLGGAAIGDRATSEWQDVYITGMGPTWGILSAIPPIILFLFTGAPIWAVIIGGIALVNLFNLLPIYPLDGGRLMNSVFASVAPGAQVVYLVLAAALVIAVTIYIKIYFIAVLFVIGILEVYFDRKNVKSGELARKPPLNRDGFILSGLWYGGLILVFIAMIYFIKDIEGADLALRMLRDDTSGL
ncbi:MAG: site-2 protease family protein [Methyloligellaceae bacterium]